MITIAAVFLRLGLTSFGGPAAHLGYFHEEFVVRRRWVSEHQYAELVALCQFLPGPASSQVGFGIGLMRGGLAGAVAAWVGFTLPSALLLVAFAFGAPVGVGAWWEPAITGLKAVVVAVVAHAVWGMARTLTPDLRRVLIGAAAIVVALTVPGVLGQVGAIVLGVCAGMVWCRAVANAMDGSHGAGAESAEWCARRVSRRAAVSALTLFTLLLIALPMLARLFPTTVSAAADAFYRAGAFVFGGGHVVLPLLQSETAIAQTVSSEQFLAGYGAAQAVPGPLFTFSAYLGSLMGAGDPTSGITTALVALLMIFLPGMLLLVGVLPFWDRLRRFVKVRAAVLGASAAVVGILAAALIDPVFAAGVTDLWTLLLALICLALLTVWKLPAWVVVLVGAAAGFVLP